jgi:hypothetical protein
MPVALAVVISAVIVSGAKAPSLILANNAETFCAKGPPLILANNICASDRV